MEKNLSCSTPEQQPPAEKPQTFHYAVSGTTQARFVNSYSPAQSGNVKRYELNTDVYLDEELCEVLEDDRRHNVKHHLIADRALKEFLLQKNQHAASMKV